MSIARLCSILGFLFFVSLRQHVVVHVGPAEGSPRAQCQTVVFNLTLLVTADPPGADCDQVCKRPFLLFATMMNAMRDDRRKISETGFQKKPQLDRCIHGNTFCHGTKNAFRSPPAFAVAAELTEDELELSLAPPAGTKKFILPGPTAETCVCKQALIVYRLSKVDIKDEPHPLRPAEVECDVFKVCERITAFFTRAKIPQTQKLKDANLANEEVGKWNCLMNQIEVIDSDVPCQWQLKKNQVSRYPWCMPCNPCPLRTVGHPQDRTKCPQVWPFDRGKYTTHMDGWLLSLSLRPEQIRQVQETRYSMTRMQAVARRYQKANQNGQQPPMLIGSQNWPMHAARAQGSDPRVPAHQHEASTSHTRPRSDQGGNAAGKRPRIEPEPVFGSIPFRPTSASHEPMRNVDELLATQYGLLLSQPYGLATTDNDRLLDLSLQLSLAPAAPQPGPSAANIVQLGVVIDAEADAEPNPQQPALDSLQPADEECPAPQDDDDSDDIIDMSFLWY